MLRIVYQFIAWTSFLLASPLVVIYALGGSPHEWRQRLGFYPRRPRSPLKKKRIWLHAASVGEVQVARALIKEVERQIPEAEIWVSTLTRHGYQHCRETLPETVTPVFAPLDLAGVCGRAMTTVDPDLYVCLETELWPEIIRQAQQQGAGPLLLNARLSAKSVRRYGLWPASSLIRRTLGRFRAIAAIGSDDVQRFRDLGADPARIVVCGNAKYDLRLAGHQTTAEDERNQRQQQEQRRRQLDIQPDQPVLVAGSTHEGEEELLITAWQRLRRNLPGLVLIIAPRHMRRLPDIGNFLRRRDLAYRDLSEFDQVAADAPSDPATNSATNSAPAPETPPETPLEPTPGRLNQRGMLLVVDRMGELAKLYEVADYVFCGGSMVRKGGHNLLEAASLGKPVLFGPYMDDFREDADLLLKDGGGFRVADDEDICQRIMAFHTRPAEYHRAAERAREIAGTLRGAARQQARIIKKELYSDRNHLTTRTNGR